MHITQRIALINKNDVSNCSLRKQEAFHYFKLRQSRKSRRGEELCLSSTVSIIARVHLQHVCAFETSPRVCLFYQIYFSLCHVQFLLQLLVN
jgi:hypothetical protein